MDAGPRIDSYAWSGGREPMIRFGPEGGPVVVLALPLFEEANRTRAFGIAILRALAGRGIGGVLPELPGQGESERPTSELCLTDLRAAFAAAPGSHVVTIRSGALLADAARPCWQLSPQTGPDLLRELSRMKGSESSEEPHRIAGNLIQQSFLAELATLHPREGGGPVSTGWQLDPRLRGHGRTVRLVNDDRVADVHVEGQALWRRAEPANSFMLAETLTDDIAAWIRTCAA